MWTHVILNHHCADHPDIRNKSNGKYNIRSAYQMMFLNRFIPCQKHSQKLAAYEFSRVLMSL